jgi:hypothetical protein
VEGCHQCNKNIHPVPWIRTRRTFSSIKIDVFRYNQKNDDCLYKRRCIQMSLDLLRIRLYSDVFRLIMTHLNTSEYSDQIYSDVFRLIMIQTIFRCIQTHLNKSEYIWLSDQIYSDVFRLIMIQTIFRCIQTHLNKSEYIWILRLDVFRRIQIYSGSNDIRMY